MPLLIRLPYVLILVAVCAGAGAQTLHRGLGPEPDALDIHLAQGLSSINILRDLFEGLVTLDAGAELIPGVAQHWSVSQGTEWVFELDPAARWSDGRAVTADDFVRAWRRALDPATASPTAGLLDPIKNAVAVRGGTLPPEALGVRAPEAHRLEVTLARPTAWFTELLTHPVTYPLPPAFDPDHPAAIGNGAFRLTRRVPGSHLRLERQAHFREAGTVALEAVVWHAIEDPAVELSRYRAGELHITESIPPGRADWLRERYTGQLRIAPYIGSFFFAFNLGRPPFKDAPALREALSLVIDRALIAEKVIGAGELPAWRLVPPGMPGWPEEAPPMARLAPEARIARAKELYALAGYDRGRPLRVELRYNTTLTHRRVAAAVAAMWRQHLGVETRLVNEEWKVFVVNRRHGRLTEVVRGGWIADYRDPGNFLELFESASPMNWSFNQDPVYDELLAAAAGQEGARRTAILWQAEQRLLARHVIIPLYYYVSRHLVDERVQGFEDNVMDIHLSRWLDVR